MFYFIDVAPGSTGKGMLVGSMGAAECPFDATGKLLNVLSPDRD
jgi:hypothetical protein